MSEKSIIEVLVNRIYESQEFEHVQMYFSDRYNSATLRSRWNIFKIFKLHWK
jgi:hypothetical protein